MLKVRKENKQFLIKRKHIINNERIIINNCEISSKKLYDTLKYVKKINVKKVK